MTFEMKNCEHDEDVNSSSGILSRLRNNRTHCLERCRAADAQKDPSEHRIEPPNRYRVAIFVESIDQLLHVIRAEDLVKSGSGHVDLAVGWRIWVRAK
jgi:hypothetical protein